MKRADAPDLTETTIPQKKIRNLVLRLSEIKGDIAAKESEAKAIRERLGELLTAAKEEGVRVDTATVSWVTSERKTLDRSKLLQLGVTKKVLDLGTNITTARYVEVRFPRATGDGEDF